MNIAEANATSLLLSWITGRGAVTAEQARTAAEHLAARSTKALHAGITPEHVRANWPDDRPTPTTENGTNA